MITEEAYRDLIPNARSLANRYRYDLSGLTWRDLLHEGIAIALRKGRSDARYIHGIMRLEAIEAACRHARLVPFRHRYDPDNPGDPVNWVPDSEWEPENVGLHWTPQARERERQVLERERLRAERLAWARERRLAVIRQAETGEPGRTWRDGIKDRMRQRVRQRYEQTAQAAD